MTWEAWFTLGIILFQSGMLISTRTGPDIILLGGVTLLLVFNVLTPEEALGGLANEGMVTVGVLYIIVAGLRETGGIGWLVERCLGRPKSVLEAQWRLMVPVIGMSSFLNNTPVVAMLIPAVKEWAKNYHLPVSQLLIPLSYASILGGVCTLIGTSTNLVVYGLLLKNGYPALQMFDIAWVGLPVAGVGLIYILIFGRKWLPNRQPVITALADSREYTVEMIVEPDSPLDEKSIESAGLRNLTGMYLIEIERDGRIIPAVSPQERLKINDRLVFCGIVESIVDLQRIRGLKPATNQVFKLDSPRPERCLIETVVSNSCALVGRTIRDGRFRNHYNAVVIAVARHGKRINKKIGDIILQPGDTLLLEAHPSFLDQQKNSRDFYLISQVADSHPLRHERSYAALGILAGMVSCVTFGLLSMLKAAMLAAGMMLITRCCKVSTARRSVDWQVLMVIAASFALGNALEKSGLAHAVGHGLISLAGSNPWISLALVYLVTILFTELITNNAAAVLVFPIAMSTARDLGVNFMPFAIAIMLAASASFATPIGYQTNLMVYGPGGYHFTDYMKIGIPLGFCVAVTVIGLTPFFWPF